MIKTHNKTGLKYLCKCTNRDPYKYKGSGVYWKRHLKEHGRDITTEVIFQTEDLDEFNSICLRYSKDGLESMKTSVSERQKIKYK